MDRDIVMKFQSLFEIERNKLIQSQRIALSGSDDFVLQKDDLLDEADLSSSELEQSMRMRLRAREGLFLKKIDEALARIADGSFGLCECCGDDIEQRRLEARPTTTMCVACKEEDERREQIHIDGHRSKSLARAVSPKLRVAL